MILKGSQRGGALKLAAHLTNLRDNDHVELYELRGFCGESLREALREAEAVAKGTACSQFLFSLSLNPPETEQVTAMQFVAAIEQAEEKLGLTGQPRAIIFHEKEGRRHAHAVWSRIDVAQMKAINLPFYKTRLKDVSKALFLEHGWRLPEGYRDGTRRNPLNFTQAEWQQARRAKQNAQTLKITLQECWSISDSRASFARALEDQGFALARGDRRGFVAVDWRGEVYSLSRWLGVKSKALGERLGDPASLPEVATVKAQLVTQITAKLAGFAQEVEAKAEAELNAFQQRKDRLRREQRAQRQELREAQQSRADREAVARAARFRSGIRGLWDWISGRSKTLRRENEIAAQAGIRRDAQEREAMISTHLTARRGIQQEARTIQRRCSMAMEELRCDMAVYAGLCSNASAEKMPEGHRRRAERSRPSPTR